MYIWEILSFLLATLGSVGFWVTYFIVGSIIGTITLKTMAKDTFKYITTGEMTYVGDGPDYVVLAFLHYILWPGVLLVGVIILALWLTYKCSVLFIWPLFHEWILLINKVVPIVKFKKGEKKTEEVYEEYGHGGHVLVNGRHKIYE